MLTLNNTFSELQKVGTDGFSVLFEGVRRGEVVQIRLVDPADCGVLGDPELRLLASPLHPAVLPVESGLVSEGRWFSASMAGTSLRQYTSLGAARRRPLPSTSLEAAHVLASAARVYREHVGHWFPLTWHNIHVGPSGMIAPRVFPLWFIEPRMQLFLRQRPEDLCFFSRHTIRLAPNASSEVHAIGLALALFGGWEPRALEPQLRTEQLIERLIIDPGLPILPPPNEDVHGEIVHRCLAPSSHWDLGCLVAALDAARAAYEPSRVALKHRREGDPILALALLSRAVQEGFRGGPLLVLKGWLEVEIGQPGRANRTALEAHAAAPSCPEVLSLLLRASLDLEIGLEASRRAAEQDPLDPRLQLRLAKALLQAGRIHEANRVLEVVRWLAMGDPGAGEILLEFAALMGAFGEDIELALLQRMISADPDPAVRAQLFARLGFESYQHGRYAEAEAQFAAAYKLGLLDPKVEFAVLKFHAFALSALGRLDEAAKVARGALAMEPGHVDLERFLHALDPSRKV